MYTNTKKDSLVEESVISSPYDRIPIVNYQINKLAKLSAEEFNDKIYSIQYLRYHRNKLRFSLYPENEDELKINGALWEYINGDQNRISKEIIYIYFNIYFPKELIWLLQSHSKPALKKFLVTINALRLLYNNNEMIIMENEMLPEYYYDSLKLFKTELQGLVSMRHEMRACEEMNDVIYFRKKFDKQLIKFLNKKRIPPYMYHYLPVAKDLRFPIHHEYISNNKAINLEAGYFTDRDWDRVILQGDYTDSLQTAEGKEQVLNTFICQYRMFHNL